MLEFLVSWDWQRNSEACHLFVSDCVNMPQYMSEDFSSFLAIGGRVFDEIGQTATCFWQKTSLKMRISTIYVFVNAPFMQVTGRFLWQILVSQNGKGTLE
jgi:hypothetical protein